MTRSARPSGDRGWAAARRAAARAHHPDVGGDPDEFMATLTAIDVAHGRIGAGRGQPVRVVVRHPRWRRVVTMITRAGRRVLVARRHYGRL